MPKQDPSTQRFTVYQTTNGPVSRLTFEIRANYFSLKTPGYPSRIQQNNMQIFEEHRYMKPGLRYNSAGELYSIFTPEFPPMPAYGSYSSQARFNLLNRLNTRLHEGKVDLLTALAERKSSIQMIATRVDQAVPMLIAYKKNSQRLQKRIKKAALAPKKLKRLVKMLSDLRLEFSFGWAPLAQDIYTLGNEIMPPIFYADVKASVNEEQQTFPSFGYVGGYMGSVKLKAFARVSMANPVTSSASQLGLTDPAVTAWEIVPWSFAIDWILPIGDYLSQINMFSGLRLETGSLTVRQRGNATHTFQSGVSASTQIDLRFGKRGSLPTPSLPRFVDSPLGNFSRTLNQLALLGQMVGKTRRY